jgi:hypothetical protein
VTDNAQVLVFVGWWRGQNGKEKKKKEDEKASIYWEHLYVI